MASHLELVRVASPPSIPLEMTADMRQFVGMMSRRKFLLTHPVWDVTAIYSILQSQHPHISRDGLIIHLELY